MHIKGAEAGLRLDEFLARKFGWLSRIRLRNAIRDGRCLVNGEPADRGTRLRAGDVLSVSMDLAAPSAMLPEEIPLEVLYEDDAMIVVVKPAGMLVHPTRRVKGGTLANALSGRWNPFLADPALRVDPTRKVIRPGFPHRLDRLTSGLIVASKTPEALRTLSLAFARRDVEKRYIAIVDGRWEGEGVEISVPVGRVPDAQPAWRVTPSGREAVTRVRILEREPAASLVELEPVTGRTNQLRIHCAHMGHAILGDTVYGGAPASRLCLHAAYLRFHHPASKERVEFHSPAPAEMRALWEASCKNG